MTKTPAKLRAGCVMTDMDSATIPCTAERTCLAVKRQVSSRGTRLQVKGPRPLDRRAVAALCCDVDGEGGREGGREAEQVSPAAATAAPHNRELRPREQSFTSRSTADKKGLRGQREREREQRSLPRLPASEDRNPGGRGRGRGRRDRVCGEYIGLRQIFFLP